MAHRFVEHEIGGDVACDDSIVAVHNAQPARLIIMGNNCITRYRQSTANIRNPNSMVTGPDNRIIGNGYALIGLRSRFIA